MLILNKIQQELKVPKQGNKSVAYKSRSAEDIVEMVKPLLGEAILNLSDEIVMIGDRYYVKATATISCVKPNSAENEIESMSAVAYAREDETPKFMSLAQGTGSTSSYARKYALNGLFAIDDTQDDDTREHTPTGQTVPNKATPPKKVLPLKQQISDAILKAKDLPSLKIITEKTKLSDKLTDIEKTALEAEMNIKAMDFEDVEITPDTVPFNN
jgi:hypothetical protein